MSNSFSLFVSRLVRAAAPVGGIAMLAACAPPPLTTPTAPARYVAPGGPTARLVMRGSVPQGDVYGVYVHDDAVGCKTPRLAGAGNATRTPVSTALAADQLATVDFRVFKADKRTCFVRYSFTPSAGRSYLINGVLTANGCTTRLLDATDPDAIKPVEGALVRNSSTQACLGLNEARAINVQRTGGQSGGDAVLMPGANASELEGLLK